MPFCTVNVPPGTAPKRGDLLQTNCGDRRERTWFVLAVHRVVTKAPDGKARFRVWRERWWELEADFRMRLFRSAERHGGQTLWLQNPRTFENLRRRKRAA